MISQYTPSKCPHQFCGCEKKVLNIFQSYCEIWKLEVNVNKTKVKIFSKGKIRLKYEFKLQNKTLEIVDSY
jgi:hypothetical protein